MIRFITGNKGKLTEAQAILGDVEGVDIDLPEIQEIDPHKIIREKLEEARKTEAGNLIVEDTSLYISELNGLPGPLIKWFLKSLGNDGIYDLAKRLESQKAEAKTIIGYNDDKGEVHFFEGSIERQIVKPAGEGFGWDPIFKPNEYEVTFGEMDAVTKNQISMRKIALEKLMEYINGK